MRRRAGLITLLVSAAVALYALGSLAATGGRLRELDGRRDALEAEVAALEAERARLVRETAGGGDADRAEDAARSRLGLVYPDEIIFYDIG